MNLENTKFRFATEFKQTHIQVRDMGVYSINSLCGTRITSRAKHTKTKKTKQVCEVCNAKLKNGHPIDCFCLKCLG